MKLNNFQIISTEKTKETGFFPVFYLQELTQSDSNEIKDLKI